MICLIFMQTWINACVHAYAHINTYINAHITHRYIHTHTYRHIHTHTLYAYIHIHAHTHTRTHTGTYVRTFIDSCLPTISYLSSIAFLLLFRTFLLFWSICYLHPCGYTLNTWTDNIYLSFASMQCKQMLLLPSVHELLLIQSFLHSLIPTDNSSVSTPKSAFSELYAKLFWDMLDIFGCTLHIH